MLLCWEKAVLVGFSLAAVFKADFAQCFLGQGFRLAFHGFESLSWLFSSYLRCCANGEGSVGVQTAPPWASAHHWGKTAVRSKLLHREWNKRLIPWASSCWSRLGIFQASALLCCEVMLELLLRDKTALAPGRVLSQESTTWLRSDLGWWMALQPGSAGVLTCSWLQSGLCERAQEKWHCLESWCLAEINRDCLTWLQLSHARGKGDLWS